MIILLITSFTTFTGCKVEQEIEKEYKCIDTNDGHLAMLNNAYITSFKQPERTIEGYEMYFISNYSHCVPLDLNRVRQMYRTIYENGIEDN